MSPARSITVSKSPEGDRRAQTRRHVLDATRELLATGEAFATLSIQRIVEKAGVSRATFYLHFRSKRELIAALAQMETSQWRQIAAPFLMNPNATRKVLQRAVAELLVVWRRHHAVIAGIIELAEYDEETREGWRDTVHEIARVVGQAIHQRRPKLSADQAEQIGRLIVWAGERFLHQETRDSNEETDKLRVDSLADMIWRVMKP